MSASHSFFCGDVSFCGGQHRRLSGCAGLNEADAQVSYERRSGSLLMLWPLKHTWCRCQRKIMAVILQKWAAPRRRYAAALPSFLLDMAGAPCRLML